MNKKLTITRMNELGKNISHLIKQGEGIALEFKECRNALNKDIYETICAFLNRHGGTLLLGVSDSKKITGVNPDYAEQTKKDFVANINNPQKINPACYLSIDEIVIDKKLVLRVFVPESSQVHRCNGRIYDRNQDGDLDITNHTRLVSEMYHRKQTSYSENKIYPYAKLTDLKKGLIAKVRKMASMRREDHPWKDMDDMTLLKSSQLYQTDHDTGKSGITLAGALLLGKEELVLSVVPHHRTDLILRKVNLDRYDDRDFVTANLVESYERIMAFVAKHLPDPFYLEGDISISIRDAIFREVASNILIHREYLNPFPAKLIIENGQVRTENSNKPHGFGLINPATFSPLPKNPVIARFFREIGRADELGSGVRKMMKYGKAYGGANPELIEGDIFRIIVKTPEAATATVDTSLTPEVTGEVAGEVTGEVTGEVIKLLRCCGSDMSRKELQTTLGLKSQENFRKLYLIPALQAELVEMTIPTKPNSRLQKYRLTAKGKRMVKNSKKT